MAEPNLVQRGLQSLSDGFKGLRTGEGQGQAARLGKSVRRGAAKAKTSFQRLTTLLGLTVGADAFDDDLHEQRRRKRAQELIGNEEPLFVARQPNETRDLNSTVAPEYRGQVAAGLAAANSHTLGSTLADAPTNGGGEFNDGYDEGGSW